MLRKLKNTLETFGGYLSKQRCGENMEYGYYFVSSCGSLVLHIVGRSSNRYFDSAGISGPIPLTLAKLQNLDTVWASDNAFTGRIRNFIGSWSKLTTLRFQGNDFDGPIPASFSNLTSLTDLDLSFNKLTGRIPDALFNMSSLTHLFLGDNKLTGSLPAQKIRPLQNIDLSYNGLSGSFPSWINEQNLQLNLVGNNFTIKQSDSR